jgi:hypothetical protein
LGNIGVLAKAASKVTTDGGDGIRKGSRKEVKKRFFFDRINVSGNEFTINQSFQGAGLVFTHVA